MSDMTEHNPGDTPGRKKIKQDARGAYISRENLDLIFQQALDGFFFMMLEEPVAWNDDVDKKAVLDYIFAHQRITRVNDAMLDQYLGKEEDFLGLVPNDLFAHDLQHGRDLWWRMLDQGSIYLESAEQKFDGTPMWVEGNYICLYDQKGRFAGHFGIQREVTERKNAQERIRMLINKNADGILVVDREGTILFANPAAEKLFGVNSHELFGAPFGFPVFSREQEDGDESMEMNITRRTAAGLESRTVELRSVETRWEEQPAYLFSLRDTTERQKKAEELKKAKEKAEEANRLKDQFLANISHEVRTPLNVIMGMLDLVLSTDLVQQQKEQLQMAAESASQLQHMINDILDLSKIEAGKMELDHETFHLHETVQTVISSMTLEAKKKGLKLNYCPPRDHLPCLLVGDPGRLKQVLINLLSNAIKFTEQGYVEVSVEKVQQFHSRVELRFSVSDTGMGIDQDQVNRLFQRFSQLDGSTTRKHEGTGLGLAISKKLVELMEGDIGVTSEKGKGSTFFFTARLELQDDTSGMVDQTTAPSQGHFRGTGQDEGPAMPPAGAAVEERNQPTQTDWTCRPLHLLVVEDKPMNQKLVESLLKKKGWSAVLASSGKEALEKLEEEDFDAVLMDIQMPEMDGVQATKLIREREQATGKHLPIIAMTAHALKGDRGKYLDAGMDDYIAKPIQKENLYALLEKIATCSREHSTAEGQQPEDLRFMLKQTGNDKALLLEVIELFLQDYHQDLVTLRRAIQQKDHQAFNRTAHGLKGELGNLGAKKAFNLAYALEKMGREANLEKAEATLEQLQAEVDQLAKFFSRPENLDRI